MNRHQYLCLLFALASTFAQSQPFPNAHAHNDYEHKRPLFDALSNGFTSVEADIHLSGGKLLVAHAIPLFATKTLEQLYLKPLDSIAKRNGGKIFANYPHPFYLMIDIKTDAVTTYMALREVLARYSSLLQTTASFPPVIIFLSGNRPIDLVMNDPQSLVSLDGRPTDLGKSYSTKVMPIISDNFNQWSDWNGKGSADLAKIAALAKKVHAEGKRLRLWAIPDNPISWKALMEAGVDIINTDHLEELRRFLSSQ